jgi:hypothetical protein
MNTIHILSLLIYFFFRFSSSSFVCCLLSVVYFIYFLLERKMLQRMVDGHVLLFLFVAKGRKQKNTTSKKEVLAMKISTLLPV